MVFVRSDRNGRVVGVVVDVAKVSGWGIRNGRGGDGLVGRLGAVFGLFAVSVLVKLKFEWKRILEVVVLGQFVMERFLNEAAMIGKVGGVGAGGVNHVAHLAGALAGVVLIALLSKILPE